VMADRPDLIQSELAVSVMCCAAAAVFVMYCGAQGLAFDALQQCFRTVDIDKFMTMQPPALEWKQDVYLIIDPAAGGPRSDFALISMVRHKGMATVCGPPQEHTYVVLICRSNSSNCTRSSMRKRGTISFFRHSRKRVALKGQMGFNPRVPSVSTQKRNGL
jgi:hypothetical protein